VNQPFVFGWHNDSLYVQAFPILEDDSREHPTGADALLNAAISGQMWQKVQQHGASIDLDLVNSLVKKPLGIAMPVSKRGVTVESFVANSRHVENRVPTGSNWNGKDELLVTAEEVEAARAGTILPKPAKRARKPASTQAAPTVKKTATVQPLPSGNTASTASR
jgi:L,D-transpeptidase ErfK/SrfK